MNYAAVTVKSLEYIQRSIVSALTTLEQEGPLPIQDYHHPRATFLADPWQGEGRLSGGGGLSCVLENGAVFERGGVMFSRIAADQLPESALALGDRAALAGKPYQAAGVSLVIHPRNPCVPTVHFNVRCFHVEGGIWWFGGGMDLTPYYGDATDAKHFHQCCKNALDPFNPSYYPAFKKACDDYFYLPHRGERRGIGGVFFDNFRGNPKDSQSGNTASPDQAFENALKMIESLGQAVINAYRPIVERHMKTPYSPRQRAFQLYRRGRYVEFNLLYDRGTLFGLQSGGRSDAILVSLPPQPQWHYRWDDAPDFPERTLKEKFLQPRDWLMHHA